MQTTQGTSSSTPSTTVPEEAKSALSFRVVLAAVFAAVVMMPVAVWMPLIGGGAAGLGFTTILLFAYIARNYGNPLTKQEIQLMNATISVAGFSVFFAGFIQNTYFSNSPEAHMFGITDYIPNWWVPSNPAIRNQVIRTFFVSDWLLPISISIATGVVLSNLISLSLGFLVYQLYVVEEKLPFPFARVEAETSVTLGEREPRKLRAMLLGFLICFIYSILAYGLPLVGGALGLSFSLIPVPYIDLTKAIEPILPGAVFGFATYPFTIFSGFVVPITSIIWLVIGSLAIWVFGNTIVVTYFRSTLFPEWTLGFSLTLNWQRSLLYVWASAAIGFGLAVAVVQFTVGRKAFARAVRSLSSLSKVARAEGMFPLWAIAAMYLGGTAAWLGLVIWLLPGFPAWPFVFLIVVWPFLSTIINARAVGEQGYGLPSIPLRETLYIASMEGVGIPTFSNLGVGVWFAPLPPSSETWSSQFYAARYVGLRIGDVVKSLLLVALPLSLIMSFIYVSTIWSFGPIPSQAYPYAQITWPIGVIQSALWITRSGTAFKSILINPGTPPILEGAFAVSLLLYLAARVLHLPFSLVGLAGGIGIIPPDAFAILTGYILYALLCRKFGKSFVDTYKWPAYAGIFIGYGVSNALSIALTTLVKSIWIAPY